MPNLESIIRELEEFERVTPAGPWEWACDFGIGDEYHWNVHRMVQPDRTVCLGLVSMASESWSLDRYPTDEMRYLTAARNAVPMLLREIRRLRDLKREVSA